ncbi:MAG: single-stranded DNA-binding protein [Elusimicrobia bacterium]|nr:single-stranded DNA-binding protein [Elusimicrobiota bacterium]
MASFSKVILMGNVTRDPEVRFAPSGTPIAGFGVGINRRYKLADGSPKDEACFVDITFFGKQAEICQNYVHKGDSILVEGRLKQDTWESKDGQKRSKLVVIGERLHLMPKKSSKGPDVDEDSVSETPVEEYTPSTKTKKKKADEIPF